MTWLGRLLIFAAGFLYGWDVFTHPAHQWWIFAAAFVVHMVGILLDLIGAQLEWSGRAA